MSSNRPSIVVLPVLAVIVGVLQFLMVVGALGSSGFSWRWKVKALFLLPVLPLIAFCDVFVRFLRGDLP